MVDLGTLTWIKNSSPYFFYSNTSPLFGRGGTALVSSTAKNVCENYKHDTVALSDPVNGRFCVANSQEIPILRLSDNRFNDVQSLKVALDGVKAVFELYTPTTYNLTPTEIKSLLGENNIYADCGSTSVTYRADTTSYIGKIITATKSGTVTTVYVKDKPIATINDGTNGTDYTLTTQDKADIAQQVINILPTAQGVSF